jgi:hypothetical protein
MKSKTSSSAPLDEEAKQLHALLNRLNPRQQGLASQALYDLAAGAPPEQSATRVRRLLKRSVPGLRDPDPDARGLLALRLLILLPNCEMRLRALASMRKVPAAVRAAAAALLEPEVSAGPSPPPGPEPGPPDQAEVLQDLAQAGEGCAPAQEPAPWRTQQDLEISLEQAAEAPAPDLPKDDGPDEAAQDDDTCAICHVTAGPFATADFRHDTLCPRYRGQRRHIHSDACRDNPLCVALYEEEPERPA